jgi:chemotaxis protein MotB
VKILARKKKEEGGGGGNAPWLNTFADLMNLLLCFFVLLFAFSNVDGEKFEKMSISMANSFGVFKGGGPSLGDGQLISSGMTKMTQLNDFFSKTGDTSHQSEIENEGEYDPTNPENTEEGTEGKTGAEGAKGLEGTETSVGSGNANIDKAMETIEKEMEEVTSGMYDKASDLSEQYNLGDYVELDIDPEYQYVQLTLKGSVLYDSGDAEIKDAAKPILTKVGDILNKFNGYSVEIVGHTDNVPMNSGAFEDNNWLSSARALNAAEYLIDKCDIDPKNLKYSGRGEYEPISSNATEEGRAKNRRIEIKIYNQYSR